MTVETLEDQRLVIWFDIDNTLYSASSKISQAMGQRIHAYFVSLGLSEDEASELHLRYYSQYGLALRGLVHHHEIDPLDFDSKCDGTLPLEDMIRPNPAHRNLFQDIDRTKVRVWALTNAYKNHARRVLKILDLEDQIEGLVYCDYAQPDFTCKPEAEFYLKAMKQARVTDPSKCLFVDDNRGNVEAAKKLGWSRCAHFYEFGMETVEGGQVKKLNSEGQRDSHMDDIVMIKDLEELRVVWPDIFKK